MCIHCIRLVQYLQTQHVYLVLAASPDVGNQVATVGHRIPHGLVWVVHADLEAHAVGQAHRGASHHLLPNGQAFLDRPLPAFGLNAFTPLLHQQSHMGSLRSRRRPGATACASAPTPPHALTQKQKKTWSNCLCFCTNRATCPHSRSRRRFGAPACAPVPSEPHALTQHHRKAGSPARLLPQQEALQMCTYGNFSA